MASSRSTFYCSSSSASPPQIKYDVFVSFRGEDTRYNFTSHLLKALYERGINTVVDNGLYRGDGISPSVLTAIEESRISIIIFSEHYASSRWCLQELVKILECKNRETNKQMVIPVFYGVTPSDLRNQTGSIAHAFAEYEERFKEDLEQVRRWKDALKEAANLSGWASSDYRTEASLIEVVTKDVLRILTLGHLGLFVKASLTSPPHTKYDVYLSFKREDTCFNFVSHLDKALNERGIITFNDENLNKGCEIAPALFTAIEESRISIIIFSENYAYSKWCLEELVKILECKHRETNKQTVIPLFYEVDPAHVRNGKGSFARAFTKHEERFEKNLERVHRWKDALKEAASLPGWALSVYETEASFVDEISKAVFNRLKIKSSNVLPTKKRFSSDVANGLISAEFKARKRQQVDDDGSGGFFYNGRFRRIMSWQKVKLLGSGSFGTVFEAITDDGFFFAIKEVSLLDPSHWGKKSVLQLEQEISLLSRFEHENIVRYFGTHKDENMLYIFLELVTEGSLANLHQKFPLGDSHVSAYTRQILNGVKYLHDQNVVHRDIKCANVLVDANGCVKLADFGLAKVIETNYVKSMQGTAFWMAPEVMKPGDHGYGRAVDIWSLGCTVLEMLTGQHPYPDLKEGVQALFKLCNGEPPPVPITLSREAQDFILKCIQINPDNRPSAAQLLDHPFIKEHCK